MISAIHKQDGALGDVMGDVLILSMMDNFEGVCLPPCLSCSCPVFILTLTLGGVGSVHHRLDKCCLLPVADVGVSLRNFAHAMLVDFSRDTSVFGENMTSHGIHLYCAKGR